MAEEGRWQEPIVVGWTPPDITGVFKTATDFFEASAADGNAQGFDIEIISQSPATHVSFADQVAIIHGAVSDAVSTGPVSASSARIRSSRSRMDQIPVGSFGLDAGALPALTNLSSACDRVVTLSPRPPCSARSSWDWCLPTPL